MVWYPEYKIAPGWNNVAGLVSIEGLAVPEDRFAFTHPKGIKQFSPGIRKTRADGSDYFVGHPSTRWIFGVMTWKQWSYAKDTFCASKYSGQVTIRTRTTGLEYKNFNAVLKLPTELELPDSSVPMIPDVVWTFTQLSEII